MAHLGDERNGKVRAGLALIGAIVVAAAAVFLLDILVRATAEGERITVVTAAAPGLRPGSSVWVAGRPVGRVLSVSLRDPGSGDDHVVIRAALDRSAENILRADASAEVVASDLLAPVVVAVSPGSPGAPPWNYSDTLRAEEPAIDQELMRALADTLFLAAEDLEAQAEVTARLLSGGDGTLQRLREDPALLEGLSSELRSLRSTLAARFPGSALARLAADTTVGPTAARIQERFEAWKEGGDGPAPGDALAEAGAELDRLAARIGRMSERLEAGEGTAGRALADRELARQFERLKAGIETLARDLARDPSRWLRVRVF